MTDPHPCSYWHRRMLAKFAERGLTHPKCGQPWADHAALGECPKPEADRCTDLTPSPRGPLRCILPAGHDADPLSLHRVDPEVGR